MQSVPHPLSADAPFVRRSPSQSMNYLDEHFRIALERVGADAWEELCRAAPEDVAAKLGMSVQRRGNVVVSRCLVADGPLGNRAIGLGLGEPCTREAIDWLVNEFKTCNLRNFALQISPFAGPAAIARWLPEAGLIVRSRWMKMVRENMPPPKLGTRFEIKRIGPRAANLFSELSTLGFGHPSIVGHWMCATTGFPRWRHYVAFQEAEPAAAAALYMDGQYAWLGMDSTLPEFRGRGAHKALIRQRLLDGIAMGARFFIAETERLDAAHRNLAWAGFRLAYERPNYGLPTFSTQ